MKENVFSVIHQNGKYYVYTLIHIDGKVYVKLERVN